MNNWRKYDFEADHLTRPVREMVKKISLKNFLPGVKR